MTVDLRGIGTAVAESRAPIILRRISSSAPPSLATVTPRRRGTDQAEQLLLPTPSAPKSRQRIEPASEQAAKVYIARRAKPSLLPGRVKLTFTLDIRRELAIRENVNLDLLSTSGGG